MYSAIAMINSYTIEYSNKKDLIENVTSSL